VRLVDRLKPPLSRLWPWCAAQCLRSQLLSRASEAGESFLSLIFPTPVNTASTVQWPIEQYWPDLHFRQPIRNVWVATSGLQLVPALCLKAAGKVVV
jgi:hypothetical protein